MSAANLPWLPARLPDGYSCTKSRLVQAHMVVLGQSASASTPARLFVRERATTDIETIAATDGHEVLDFEHLPSAGGVFVLMAKRIENGHLPTGIGWVDHYLARLDLVTKSLHLIYSDDNWRESRGAFPVALLGSSPDGHRVAVACGELAPGVEEALHYRVGYIAPATGDLELNEELLGLFF